MLFPPNNISFSFFFLLPLVAGMMLLNKGEGRHEYPSAGPRRQTLPVQTDVSDCPLSNLSVASAPNVIHLSLPQFPHLLSATDLLWREIPAFRAA